MIFIYKYYLASGMFLLFTAFLLIKGILCAPAYEDPKKPFQEVERTDIREIILYTRPLARAQDSSLLF